MLVVPVLFLAGLVAATFLWAVPPVVLAVYAILSVLAFGMYGADKSAAKRGRWRTPEVRLHAVALAGGWPGAMIAQRVFRHKTRKRPFQGIFWFTVVANCGALAWYLGG